MLPQIRLGKLFGNHIKVTIQHRLCHLFAGAAVVRQGPDEIRKLPPQRTFASLKTIAANSDLVLGTEQAQVGIVIVAAELVAMFFLGLRQQRRDALALAINPLFGLLPGPQRAQVA